MRVKTGSNLPRVLQQQQHQQLQPLHEDPSDPYTRGRPQRGGYKGNESNFSPIESTSVMGKIMGAMNVFGKTSSKPIANAPTTTAHSVNSSQTGDPTHN